MMDSQQSETKVKEKVYGFGFFLYDVLSKFIQIAEYRKDTESIRKYEEVKENLKRNLNTIGWDGRWYKRAITDDGDILRKHRK